MALKSGERENTCKIQPGIHEAVFLGVWDLGEQMMAGKFPGEKHRCLIMWELISGDTVTKEYTWFKFLPERSILRKDLESWRSTKFNDDQLKAIDYSRLPGQHCQLLVMVNDKGYAQVENVLPARDVSWQPHQSIIYYEIGDKIPEGTPNWVINKIQSSKELAGSPAGGSQGAAPTDNQQHHGGGEDDSTVPF